MERNVDELDENLIKLQKEENMYKTTMEESNNDVGESEKDLNKILASTQMEFLMRVVGKAADVNRLRIEGRKILEKAWRIGSVAYGIQDAIKWGDNFVFPEGIGDIDARDLKRAGSVAALCKERHQIRASKCLSVERVNR